MIKKVKLKISNFFYYKQKEEQILPNETLKFPDNTKRYHTGNLTMYGYMLNRYYIDESMKIDNDFIIV